jgi:hypothetical protein
MANTQTYIWGLLVVIFILDYARKQFFEKEEKSTTDNHEEYEVNKKYEGMKVKDGDKDLPVDLDTSLHNYNDKPDNDQLIKIKIQYWYVFI